MGNGLYGIAAYLSPHLVFTDENFKRRHPDDAITAVALYLLFAVAEMFFSSLPWMLFTGLTWLMLTLLTGETWLNGMLSLIALSLTICSFWLIKFVFGIELIDLFVPILVNCAVIIGAVWFYRLQPRPNGPVFHSADRC